jgi:DNA-binding MarR family transcriptional regulator
MLMLKDLPKYECLLEGAKRYPDLDPTSCESFLTLMRVASDVLEAFGQFLASYQLSQGRFTVLMLLNRNPEQPANPADLAERSGVTRATMTGLIDGLERDGFVKREPDLNDRRMMVVRLTEKARGFLDTMLPDYFRRISALMGHLQPQERKTLVHLLWRMHAGVASVWPAKGGE